jgi:hypothetical protein
MKSGPHEKKSNSCRNLSDPNRRRTGCTLPSEDEQGERHERKSSKLDEGSLPDKGDSSPSERRAVGIRPMADESSKGGKNDGERDHHTDKGSRYTELDNHDPIQGSHKENQGHPYGHLKEREAKEPPQWEVRGRHIGKGEEAGPKCGPSPHESFT